MSNKIAKYRQILPYIDKYRQNRQISTDIDKYRQNRQISKFIDSYRHTLSKRLGGQHLGEKNKPPRKPRWKIRERIPRPNMSCTFFFFFSFLVKLLPRPKILDAPRCLDRGYEKILGIFFRFFKKVWKYFNSENYAKKHFSNFPFNLHIIIVVLASYVRCKMAVYQYDDCKLQFTIKQ